MSEVPNKSRLKQFLLRIYLYPLVLINVIIFGLLACTGGFVLLFWLLSSYLK